MVPFVLTLILSDLWLCMSLASYLNNLHVTALQQSLDPIENRPGSSFYQAQAQPTDHYHRGIPQAESWIPSSQGHEVETYFIT